MGISIPKHTSTIRAARFRNGEQAQYIWITGLGKASQESVRLLHRNHSILVSPVVVQKPELIRPVRCPSVRVVDLV